MILPHNNACLHTANLAEKKFQECNLKYWNTLLTYPHGPPKALGGEQFNNDTGVEAFMHNGLETHPCSFYEDGFKKTSNELRKLLNKIRRLCRKIVCNDQVEREVSKYG